MATTSISEGITKADIAGFVFEGIENDIPDDKDDCYAALDAIRNFVPQELFFDLEMAINMRVGQALEDAFRIGWELRGKA